MKSDYQAKRDKASELQIEGYKVAQHRSLCEVVRRVPTSVDALRSCTAFVRSGAEGATDAAELHDALRLLQELCNLAKGLLVEKHTRGLRRPAPHAPAQAIPVDTHVWDIACRELDPTLRSRARTPPSAAGVAIGAHSGVRPKRAISSPGRRHLLREVHLT